MFNLKMELHLFTTDAKALMDSFIYSLTQTHSTCLRWNITQEDLLDSDLDTDVDLDLDLNTDLDLDP